MKPNMRKMWSGAIGVHDCSRESSHVTRGVPLGMYIELFVHCRNFCTWYAKRRTAVFEFRYIIVSHEDVLKLEHSRKYVRNALEVLKCAAGEEYTYRRSVGEIV